MCKISANLVDAVQVPFGVYFCKMYPKQCKPEGLSCFIKNNSADAKDVSSVYSEHV